MRRTKKEIKNATSHYFKKEEKEILIRKLILLQKNDACKQKGKEYPEDINMGKIRIGVTV